MTDLALIWGAILAFAVYAYVVLDGFDLGIGILAPFARSDAEEETMINSIAPVWDGNETWLVLGGGGLLAAFPLAYAILLPALYAPLIAMLLALIFRGVAFEFRHRHDAPRRRWTWGFILGSFVATFAQGVALGTFVQGIEVDGRAYGGGWFDWLTPFSLFTGAALLFGYSLLGACFLIMKTGGELQARMFRLALPLGAAVLAFLIAILIFLVSYAGLGISMFPYVVPREVTIWEAAAPDDSLAFLLVGTAVLLPIILAYTGYSYWVFRGKVDPHHGYH